MNKVKEGRGNERNFALVHLLALRDASKPRVNFCSSRRGGRGVKKMMEASSVRDPIGPNHRVSPIVLPSVPPTRKRPHGQSYTYHYEHA